MGKELKESPPASPGNAGFTIDLFGPGMTALHKVGLAGLWMTLKAMDKDEGAKKRLQKAGGSWDCTSTSVSLRWHGIPERFFKALFEESFKIDKNGLLWFPALGSPTDHPQHAVVLQEAILGSILQHGQTRKADKPQDPQGKFSVEVDETPLILRYRKVTKYAHQNAKFSVSTVNRLAGWHFPGGVVRHVGLGQDSTALEEPPERALVLRFALIGAVYFALRRPGVRTHYALVLPQISNLENYAQARVCFLRYGVQQLQLSGTAEAGLRVLAELHAAGLLEDIDSAVCRVISFGTVPWSAQQKTRIELFTVRAASERALRTFAICQSVLMTRLVKPSKSDPFWDIPQIPDLIARNLTENRLWWEGFSEFVSDKDRREHVFKYEKGGLAKMVEAKDTLPDGPERLFVLACQEALRRHMGRKFARTGGADWGNEFEKVRISIVRCKNLASFRETISEFWSRGGSLHKGEDSLLQAPSSWWQEVLPLMDEKTWRKAKDLALLALASYPGSPRESGAD